MEKLFAAIYSEPARKADVTFNLTDRLVTFVSSFSPRTLALMGSVATLVIVLQAGVIAAGLVTQKAHTEVATGPDRAQRSEMASADVSDGTLAVIRFAPKAEATGITEFLITNKASVVDGPKIGGLYTVRLSETGKAKEDHIKQMQAQSRIVDFIATVQ